MAEDKQRVDQINKIANGFGQTLLTICGGDWDLALSVALTLFASTCAQAAHEHGEPAEELFEECSAAARAATLAFEAEFKKADDNEG